MQTSQRIFANFEAMRSSTFIAILIWMPNDTEASASRAAAAAATVARRPKQRKASGTQSKEASENEARMEEKCIKPAVNTISSKNSYRSLKFASCSRDSIETHTVRGETWQQCFNIWFSLRLTRSPLNKQESYGWACALRLTRAQRATLTPPNRSHRNGKDRAHTPPASARFATSHSGIRLA